MLLGMRDNSFALMPSVLLRRYGDIFKHSLLFCSIMEKGLLGGPQLLDVFELLLAAGADVNSVSKT